MYKRYEDLFQTVILTKSITWSPFAFHNSSKCYGDIFSGNWQAYDPFSLSQRGRCSMGGGGDITFFRAFQGWTALTESGPGDGTLMLLPNVKEAMAYLLLRPLK